MQVRPHAYTTSSLRPTTAVARYERREVAAKRPSTTTTRWRHADGSWYAFIIGRTAAPLAHYNPAVRELDPSERVDVTGYFYGADLLAAQEGRPMCS